MTKERNVKSGTCRVCRKETEEVYLNLWCCNNPWEIERFDGEEETMI